MQKIASVMVGRGLGYIKSGVIISLIAGFVPSREGKGVFFQGAD